MTDVNVRLAMQCAIDRQEVLDTAAFGEGEMTGPITSPAYRSDPAARPCPERDLDKAAEYLEAAGKPDGVTVHAIVSQGEYATSVAEAQSVQAQLADANITLELEVLDSSVFVDRWVAADFEAAIALNGGRPDPDSMYGRYFTSTGNLNQVAGYSSPELDELFAAGKASTDPEERVRDLPADLPAPRGQRRLDLAVHVVHVHGDDRGRQRVHPDVERIAAEPSGHDGRVTAPVSSRRAVARRIRDIAVTLLGVSVAVFLMLRAIPGDQITAGLGTEAAALTPGQRAALEDYYGIDRALPVQYVSWLGNVITGNLGFSSRAHESVSSLTLDALPVTLELAVLAMAISLVDRHPARDVVCVADQLRTRRHRAGDRPRRAVDPGVPACDDGAHRLVVVVPLQPQRKSFAGLFENPWLNLQQLLLPAAVLGFGIAAPIMRTTRTAVIEVRSADFVRTAKAKGVSNRRLQVRHVLRNALVPIVTMAGLQFGYLLGGAVVVEQIFSVPGIGRQVLLGMQQKEYALVQSTVLVIAVGVRRRQPRHRRALPRHRPEGGW